MPHHLITDGSTVSGGQVNNDGCLLSGLPQTETEQFVRTVVFRYAQSSYTEFLRFEKSKRRNFL